MITVSFTSDINAVFNRLRSDLQKQVPFAASLALNEAAFETREFIKAEMAKHYDGGVVKFTQNAIYSTRTNKRELMTKVYVGGNGSKDHLRRIAYVLSTIDGGDVVPYKQGGKPFSPNKKKITVTKTGRNMPQGAVKRRLPKANHFIYHKPDGRQSVQKGKMPSGLYQRVGKGNRMKMKLLVAFYDKQTNEATFPARTLAKEFAKRHFKAILDKNLLKALKTAR